MLPRILMICLVLIGLVMFGCNGGSTSSESSDSEATSHPHDGHDHDGHDHAGHDHGDGHSPQTLAEAVEVIAKLRDKIQAAWADGDLEKADGPVHELGHVLEGLESLGSQASLTEEQSAELKSTTETLFASFSQLDETIHGKSDGKTWEDVAEDVNQAIAKLQEVSASSAADEEPSR